MQTTGFAQSNFENSNQFRSLSPSTSSILKGKLFACQFKSRTNKRGKVVGQKYKQKLPISLQVRNLRTQELQSRVFEPDTTDGNFFMFLLPDERYEISVNVEGFRPYIVVVYIPPQTFIYELNREIIFEPIVLLDEQIGQHNYFESRSQNLLSYYDSAVFQNYDRKRIEVLRELIDYTMKQEDMAALDKLQKATLQEKIPSFPVEYTASQREPSEKFNAIFSAIQQSFSHGSWEYLDQLYAKQSTGNTYYTKAKSISKPEQDNTKTIVTHFVLFDGKNTKRLTKEQKEKLKEVAVFLNKDPRLYIEIFGRTFLKNEEEPSKRLKLSSKRTKQVFNYLRKRVDDKSKFYYVVYGMSENLEDAAIEKLLLEEKKDDLLLTKKAPRVELVISLEQL